MDNTKTNDDYITDDELLKIIAAMVDEENFDMAEHEQRANLLNIEPDPEILVVAREYDKQRTSQRKKKIIKRFSSAAAVLVVCIGLTTAGASAFHINIFDIIFDRDSGSVALLSKSEKEIIGDWRGYWYPGYMPEGFYLDDADQTEYSKAMLYVSDDSDAEITVINEDLNTDFFYDTDTANMEQLKVGYHEGYYFYDAEYNSSNIIWQAENITVRISFSNLIDKALSVRIAEGMQYVK